MKRIVLRLILVGGAKIDSLGIVYIVCRCRNQEKIGHLVSWMKA